MTVLDAPVGVAARFPLLRRVALTGVWVLAPVTLSATVRMFFIRWGADAHAYWAVGQKPLAYTSGPGHVDAFLYSPLFADLVRPLGLLPWPVFWIVWAALEGAVLAWLLLPLGPWWAIPLWLICTPELMNGNIYVFLAAAAVLGRRRAGWWLLPVLTKVASAVGLLWFAARGEWRRLALAVALLGLVVGVSFTLQPQAWIAWVEFLTRSRGAAIDGEAGLILRCLLGAGLVVCAARLRAVWAIPVAMIIVNPIFVLTMLTMLTALPRLMLAEAEGTPRFPADKGGILAKLRGLVRAGSRATGVPSRARVDRDRAESASRTSTVLP